MATVATKVSTLELAKRAYRLFNKGDVSALMELYHQDTEWHIMGAPDIPFAGSFKGKDQVMAFLKNLDETVLFTKFKVQEFITEGDKVVGIVDCEGRVRATGKSFKTGIAHLMTIREDKLYSLRDFADTRELYKALQ